MSTYESSGQERKLSLLASVCMFMLSLIWLFTTSWTVARQASLSMEFSRQEYWSGLPCPPPGDLPDPGIRMSGASLLSEGTYLQGLSLLYVSLLAWILKSLYRSLNGVQSYILSRWSQQHLPLSRLLFWNSSHCGKVGWNVPLRGVGEGRGISITLVQPMSSTGVLPSVSFFQILLLYCLPALLDNVLFFCSLSVLFGNSSGACWRRLADIS